MTTLLADVGALRSGMRLVIGSAIWKAIRSEPIPWTLFTLLILISVILFVVAIGLLRKTYKTTANNQHAMIQAQRLIEPYLIEWFDSYGCSANWEPLENCQPEPLVCRSLGWVIHKDQKCIVIVPHLAGEDHRNAKKQGCGDMTIPTASVLRMIRVKISNGSFAE